jgi:hypothetical protein
MENRAMSENPVPIVQAWQDAVNAQDIERLLQLSDDEIELIGPRGVARGHQMLRDWMGRAGLSLETRRIFARENRVVIEQHGAWRSVETGEVMGEAEVSSRFVVQNGRVVQVARYDQLDTALADAGLTLADMAEF